MVALRRTVSRLVHRPAGARLFVCLVGKECTGLQSLDGENPCKSFSSTTWSVLFEELPNEVLGKNDGAKFIDGCFDLVWGVGGGGIVDRNGLKDVTEQLS